MNSIRQAAMQRLAAFALALVMTTGMLGAVELIASSEPSAAQLARVEAQHSART
jgi:uncharacterized membrane protein